MKTTYRQSSREKVVATESALRGRACKPLADGSVLFFFFLAQALQVFAGTFMRLHDSGALRDDVCPLNDGYIADDVYMDFYAGI